MGYTFLLDPVLVSDPFNFRVKESEKRYKSDAICARAGTVAQIVQPTKIKMNSS